MVGMIRLVLGLVISLSVALAVLPLPAVAMPLPHKSAECCAKITSGHDAKACGRQMPKSTPDRECCAACTVGLVLIAGASSPVIIPARAGESLALVNLDTHRRTERPPVPPPRFGRA